MLNRECTQPSIYANCGCWLCDQGSRKSTTRLEHFHLFFKIASSAVACNCIWSSGIHSVGAATLDAITSYRSSSSAKRCLMTCGWAVRLGVVCVSPTQCVYTRIMETSVCGMCASRVCLSDCGNLTKPHWRPARQINTLYY